MTWQLLSIPLLLHLLLFIWAFRELPRERWMMMASIPIRRESAGTWRCVNLTYYGAFSALGAMAAIATLLFLTGAAGLSLTVVATALIAILLVSIPASRGMNRLVEGHAQGFTIGGAAFVGILIAPWAAWLSARWWGVPSLAWDDAAWLLGAAAPAYAVGEGIGRLACISFGCCYGRRLRDCSAWMQRLFRPLAFVFEGPLKKAQTERDWGGQALLPVQAVTAVVCSIAGWTGLTAYLHGKPIWAAAIGVGGTQLWRFFSEFWRADYRGGGSISAYQWMALGATLYIGVMAILWPTTAAIELSPTSAFKQAVQPLSLALIFGAGLFLFLRMGVSRVTDAVVHYAATHSANPCMPHQPAKGNKS